MNVLAERIRELRTARNWSQEKTARELDMVLRTYCRCEAGEADPKTSTLIKIADLFGVSMDYLSGRTDDPHFEAH